MSRVCIDAFKLVGTHGIPLEMVLEHFKANDIVISWPHYVAHATKDGAKMKSIRAKVMAAVGEVYGPVHLRGFAARWDAWFI